MILFGIINVSNFHADWVKFEIVTSQEVRIAFFMG